MKKRIELDNHRAVEIMRAKLKPCPFCGGKAEAHCYYEKGYEVGSAIKCECGIAFYSLEACCLKDNIEAWNRRANDER